MLFLPELVPRNVQQTGGELDEELLLIQQEAKLKLEVYSLTCCFQRQRSRMKKHMGCTQCSAAGRLDPGLYA